jgi:hypothetical protein
MKISEARYTRRYNIGNYEHEEYTLAAVVKEGETGAEALIDLKHQVAAAYVGEGSIGPAPEPEEEIEQPIEEEEIPVEEEIPEETEEEVEEEDIEEEVPEEKPKKKTKAPKKEEAEEDDYDYADQLPKELVKEAPKKKSFKKKPQTYQRSNEAHKEIFSNVLKAVAPDWKKSFESKAQAKKVSQKMVGEEFLDEDGNVVASFTEAVRKAMKARK